MSISLYKREISERINCSVKDDKSDDDKIVRTDDRKAKTKSQNERNNDKSK